MRTCAPAWLQGAGGAGFAAQRGALPGAGGVGFGVVGARGAGGQGSPGPASGLALAGKGQSASLSSSPIMRKTGQPFPGARR